MSEYQFIHFLAIDRPLTDQQLEFMRTQSTRARITRREYTNEYHFGDFHGNSQEMLRRGYDLHLRYASFGIRRLMIRLPGGLPCDRRTFETFQIDGAVEWKPDQKGGGGILQIEPEADAGTYSENCYDVDGVLPKLAPIREMLISGDLRPLYLAWLACFCDESREPPVPAGLGQLTPALLTMASFYEVSEDLIAAAAQRSPTMPKTAEATRSIQTWIDKQSKNDLKHLVGQLLAGDAACADILARIRKESVRVAWPMAEPTRTMAQLHELADRLCQERLQREQKSREAARRKHLKAMAANPEKVIQDIHSLVESRSTRDYEKAACQLADLREALGPEKGPSQARAVAQQLRRKNPGRSRLVSALRKQELLD